MAIELKVPSPGESINEVQIARWIKADGDFVEKDEEIAEIDFRFDALKPYLKSNPPEFNAVAK